MNKANLNNLLSLLCMEEAGTESKEQDEVQNLIILIKINNYPLLAP